MRSGNSATARPGFRLTFPLLSAKLIKQIRRKEVQHMHGELLNDPAIKAAYLGSGA